MEHLHGRTEAHYQTLVVFQLQLVFANAGKAN